jgi:hypothetical protein
MVPNRDRIAEEEQQWENFGQQLFWYIRRMSPRMVQVSTQSKSMACPSRWKDFRQQRIHNMSTEVLRVEMPPGGIILTTWNPPISRIKVNMAFVVPTVWLTLVAASSRATLHFTECWCSNTSHLSSPVTNVRSESNCLACNNGSSRSQMSSMRQSYTNSLRGRCVLKISSGLFRMISQHLRSKDIKSNEKSVDMDELWLDKMNASKSYSAWNR